MALSSTPAFKVFHALRIKGFGTLETLADITGLGSDEVEPHLAALAEAGRAQFREARSLWQLTPEGRAAHPALLAEDLEGADLGLLSARYADYLNLNSTFKALCGDWQLRDGEVNDHSDVDYDRAVIARLADLDANAQPVVASLGQILDRLAPYAPRLSRSLTALQGGDTAMFTGVMCGSYHDAWMELHEDLILTQGIDRSAEGSF